MGDSVWTTGTHMKVPLEPSAVQAAAFELDSKRELSGKLELKSDPGMTELM